MATQWSRANTTEKLFSEIPVGSLFAFVMNQTGTATIKRNVFVKTSDSKVEQDFGIVKESKWGKPGEKIRLGQTVKGEPNARSVVADAKLKMWFLPQAIVRVQKEVNN